MKILSMLVAMASLELLLSGCAEIPKVGRYYFFPEGQSDIVIVQTVGCMGDASDRTKVPDPPILRSTAAATVSTTYIADYSSKHGPINFNEIDALLADADVAVTLTDDGRLSAVNAAGGGEAAATIKSAATIASVFTGIKPQSFDAGDAAKGHDICKAILTFGSPADKSGNTVFTLTLSYKARVQYKDGAGVHVVGGDDSVFGTAIQIHADRGSTPFDETLSDKFGPFVLTVIDNGVKDVQPMWNVSSEKQTGPHIEVPKMTQVTLILSGPIADLTATNIFYVDALMLPTNQAIKVPIPQAPAFGKLATTIQIGSSGAVQKLEYNKSSWLSDMLNSGGQVVNQSSPSDQTKAALAQSQSDLIYQQQRLVICQMDATKCTK